MIDASRAGSSEHSTNGVSPDKLSPHRGAEGVSREELELQVDRHARANTSRACTPSHARKRSRAKQGGKRGEEIHALDVASGGAYTQVEEYKADAEQHGERLPPAGGCPVSPVAASGCGNDVGGTSGPTLPP